LASTADVVICGAGIAGIAAAHELAKRQGVKNVVLVDERPPLTLTSDKSSECYRNWWPGPGDAMVAMMNRSIDLLESLAHESGNVFHLNRRGYVYATAEADNISALKRFAEEASALGAGAVRYHGEMAGGESYQPAAAEDFEGQPQGADLITDRELIGEYYPYLCEDIAALLHVRRAGWFSAQQYGMYLLAQARAQGARVVSGRVEAVETAGGEVRGVKLTGGERIAAPVFVNAAGPLLKPVGELLGVAIPVVNELHMKAAFDDHRGVIPREAPLLIYADEQELAWDEEERAMLADDDEMSWLAGRLPSGAHTRPEGGAHAQSVLMLWDVHNTEVEVVIPPPIDPMYLEMALRGLIKLIPGLGVYLEKLPQPYIDGGYYTKTGENRPLAGPLPVAGAYVIGAMSGYGIMASAALGELLGAHITGRALPDYAAAFNINRYQDPAYQRQLETWGASWQL